MLGVAIIGTGDISDYHIDSYLRFGGRCRIRALVDAMPDKARAKAEKFGLGCDIEADHRALLGRSDIDLVSICLPPSLHCGAAVDFLSAGVHVLCEKPMAPTLEECDRMLAAAASGGSVLSVVAQNRFKTDVMRTKLLLDSGELGVPFFVQANSFWWRGPRYYDLWWRGTWEKEGGGCTFIHAVHHIDLLLWLMGPAAEVSSLAANLNHGNSEVEDLSVTTVRFANGAVGSLVSSLLHHGEEQRFVVDASAASIEIPHRIAVSRQKPNGYPEADEERRAVLEARFLAAAELEHVEHRGQIDDVLTAIEDRRAPLVSGEDGRRTIEFISAVYQSSFVGGAVALPMGVRDPFYSREGLLSKAIRFHRKGASVESFGDEGISVGGRL